MLSGQYDFLVNNMWLTDIISVILFIIPFFLVFYDKKYIFLYYVVSIVANLPLIFYMSFAFSYELIIVIAVIVSIVKDVVIHKSLRYTTTKETLQFVIFLLLILVVNLLTSLFNFNQEAVLTRTIIYVVNIFILFVYRYFLISHDRLYNIINGFIIGAWILIVSMIVEMIYGYQFLNMHNLRPAGLLLDPNVSGFALNLCLVISFYKPVKTKLLYDAFIIASRVAILFGVFLTVSRSAYIASAVILVTFLIYYSKGKTKWIASTTVIVFIVMYFLFYGVINNFIRTIYGVIDLDRVFPTSLVVPPRTGSQSPNPIIEEPDYSNSRIMLIKSTLEIFKNNFVVGVGIGNVTTKMYLLNGLSMNSHNLFLQLLAESGILILFTLLIFGYYVINLIIKTKSKSRFFFIVICIVVGIEAMFNHNILNINIIWVTLAFFLAMIVIHAKEQKVFIMNRSTFRKKHRNLY